jgi:hypothetical protein
MENYQLSVIIEKAELEIKYNNLTAFIAGDDFEKLGGIEKLLLHNQHEAMEAYLLCLQNRIVYWEE